MRRVAITGYGIISPLGNDRETVVRALREGRSGVELIEERRALGFRSALGGTIKDLQPPAVPKRALRQMGRGARIAVHAAQQAIEHAGLPEDRMTSDRLAVVMGQIGCFQDVYRQCSDFNVRKLRLGGTALQKVMNSTVSANLSVLLGTRGQCFTVSAACATGATAIGQASQLIRWGIQDVALCGGVHEDSWEYVCQFDALKAFSTREDDPTRASRPFDKNRDGLVPAAGGSVVVLEELEGARERGARIYAELVGYAFASDGEDMTNPSGDGGARAIKLALDEAQITPGQVDYINAHATATQIGDVVEARIISEIFGGQPHVSSTKSMTGHEQGAAGSNELVYTLMMMEHDFVAPTINLDDVDPECGGIRMAANEMVAKRIDIAISNAFGFGGVNTCLVARRYET